MGLPAWKRFLDISLIAASCPIWLPLMLFIFVTIKLVSPGASLFRQPRIGYKGREFICLKFRTMHYGTSSSTHQVYLHQLIGSNQPMTKLDKQGDPRIFVFGRILRATGLDELPQLLNVLRGDMSIVGPRPCMSYEVEAYQPWQMERFNAVPGLTGLWQVSGKNRTTFEQMMHFDIEYTKKKNLLLDLQIICLTPSALLLQILDIYFAKKQPPAKVIRLQEVRLKKT